MEMVFAAVGALVGMAVSAKAVTVSRVAAAIMNGLVIESLLKFRSDKIGNRSFKNKKH